MKTIAGAKRVGMKKTSAKIAKLQAKKRYKVRIRAYRMGAVAERISKRSARAAKIEAGIARSGPGLGPAAH